MANEGASLSYQARLRAEFFKALRSRFLRALPLLVLPWLSLACGGSSSETPYPKEPHADQELPKYTQEEKAKAASSLLPAESQPRPEEKSRAE